MQQARKDEKGRSRNTTETAHGKAATDAFTFSPRRAEETGHRNDGSGVSRYHSDCTVCAFVDRRCSHSPAPFCPARLHHLPTRAVFTAPPATLSGNQRSLSADSRCPGWSDVNRDLRPHPAVNLARAVDPIPVEPGWRASASTADWLSGKAWYYQ